MEAPTFDYLPQSQPGEEQPESRPAGETKEKKVPIPPELRIDHLLSGTASRITEGGSTTIINGAAQTVLERRARHFDVVFMKAPPTEGDAAPEQSARICRLVRTEGGVVSIGPGITNGELERIANVTKITEEVTRSVYMDGLLISKDHTQRIYETNFVAGTR